MMQSELLSTVIEKEEKVNKIKSVRSPCPPAKPIVLLQCFHGSYDIRVQVKLTAVLWRQKWLLEIVDTQKIRCKKKNVFSTLIEIV